MDVRNRFEKLDEKFRSVENRLVLIKDKELQKEIGDVIFEIRLNLMECFAFFNKVDANFDEFFNGGVLDGSLEEDNDQIVGVLDVIDDLFSKIDELEISFLERIE